jgi:hypothetical protein
MNHTLLSVFLASLVGSGVLRSEAPPSTTFAMQESPLHPLLGGSAFAEDGEAGGNVFSLLPLYPFLGRGNEVQDRLLFLQPLVQWQDGGAYSGSLGLGYRQLFGDPTHGASRLSPNLDLFGEGWFAGANMFVDGAHTQRDSDFWQLSADVEFGSRYVTLRANYYWPLSKKQRWGQSTAVVRSDLANEYELSASKSKLSGVSDDLYDRSVHTFHPQEIRKMAIGFYEESLRGWDTDVSLLIPGIDKHVDLRLIAGLYGFEDGDVSQGFRGWRAGLEFRPVPSIVLIATHFDDDRDDEGQWLAGVRFEVPLGNNTADWLKPRTRSLRERLLEPVGRSYTPAVASGSKIDKVTSKVQRGPFTSEGLGLGPLPRPGSAIQLQDGTILIVEKDGRTLRPPKDGEPISFEMLTVVPEPSRAVLLLFGLTGLFFRRRRSLA